MIYPIILGVLGLVAAYEVWQLMQPKAPTRPGMYGGGPSYGQGAGQPDPCSDLSYATAHALDVCAGKSPATSMFPGGVTSIPGMFGGSGGGGGSWSAPPSAPAPSTGRAQPAMTPGNAIPIEVHKSNAQQYYASLKTAEAAKQLGTGWGQDKHDGTADDIAQAFFGFKDANEFLSGSPNNLQWSFNITQGNANIAAYNSKNGTQIPLYPTSVTVSGWRGWM
jgi:hypothetical protein